MLHKVKQNEIATLITYKYFTAFVVLAAAYDVALEEIVPGVSSLQTICTIELDFLSFNGEEKELP